MAVPPPPPPQQSISCLYPHADHYDHNCRGFESCTSLSGFLFTTAKVVYITATIIFYTRIILHPTVHYMMFYIHKFIIQKNFMAYTPGEKAGG